MKNMYITTKIWVKTLQKLKIIAAYENKSIAQIVEDFAEDMCKHLGVHIESNSKEAGDLQDN